MTLPEVGNRTNARRVRFGANYVPSSNWCYSWLDFDADAVRRDFEDLAGIGLDHVRIFPVWPWIQPNRNHLRSRALEDLVATIDCAGEFGLDVAVDLLQGHLSSFDFLPSWVVTWHRRSLFEDRDVRDGLVRYVGAVTEAAASRPNTFAVTLGNEVNNLWPSNPTSLTASRSWAEELLAAARASAADLWCCYSLYDAAWYDAAHPFSPLDTVEVGDVTTVHSWVFNGVSALDGPLGPATVSHADYLVELAAATATDPNRPVWLQELGAPRPDIPEEDAAEFTRRTLEAAMQNPSLCGVTWWCSHDLDRRLVDFPEREYDLGLFTVDHQPKQAAKALATFITEQAQQEPVRSRPGLVRPTGSDGIESARVLLAPGSRFHDRWVQARADGPVAIVDPARADDAAHLGRRGVTKLLAT